MRFLDVLFGRTRPVKPNLDVLFAIPSAADTLQAALDLTPTGAGAVCFKHPEGAAAAAAQTDITALLTLEAATRVAVTRDEYGPPWSPTCTRSTPPSPTPASARPCLPPSSASLPPTTTAGWAWSTCSNAAPCTRSPPPAPRPATPHWNCRSAPNWAPTSRWSPTWPAGSRSGAPRCLEEPTATAGRCGPAPSVEVVRRVPGERGGGLHARVVDQDVDRVERRLDRRRQALPSPGSPLRRGGRGRLDTAAPRVRGCRDHRPGRRGRTGCGRRSPGGYRSGGFPGDVPAQAARQAAVTSVRRPASSFIAGVAPRCRASRQRLARCSPFARRHGSFRRLPCLNGVQSHPGSPSPTRCRGHPAVRPLGRRKPFRGGCRRESVGPRDERRPAQRATAATAATDRRPARPPGHPRNVRPSRFGRPGPRRRRSSTMRKGVCVAWGSVTS